jgi:hypothetical protein
MLLVCAICIKMHEDAWGEAIKKAFVILCPPYSAMTDDARKPGI